MIVKPPLFVLFFVTIFCLLAGFYIASPHHSFTRCCGKLISTEPPKGPGNCRLVHFSSQDFKLSRCAGQDVDMFDLFKKNANTAGSN